MFQKLLWGTIPPGKREEQPGIFFVTDHETHIIIKIFFVYAIAYTTFIRFHYISESKILHIRNKVHPCQYLFYGYTLWNKSFNSEKIQPNLIPSKITHWMSRLELQNKFYNLSLVLGDWLYLALFKKIWWYNSCQMIKYCSYFDEIRTTLRELGTLIVSY